MLETLALMGSGFANALSPVNLFAMAAGTAIGIVIGCHGKEIHGGQGVGKTAAHQS